MKNGSFGHIEKTQRYLMDALNITRVSFGCLATTQGRFFSHLTTTEGRLLSTLKQHKGIFWTPWNNTEASSGYIASIQGRILDTLQQHKVSSGHHVTTTQGHLLHIL